MTGAGFIFKFAFERESVHTIDTLKDELDGIVLNGGTVDTKNPQTWSLQNRIYYKMQETATKNRN